MAEPDAAGPAHVSGPQPPAQKGSRSLTLAEIQRGIARQLEPLEAARREAERSMAPMLAAARTVERQQKQIAAMVDRAIGPYLREIVGIPAQKQATAPPSQDSAGSSAAPAPAATVQAVAAFDASPAAMSALVDRVAAEVVKRLAAAPVAENGPIAAATNTSRRGRRRREVSVGGVDAALEALAEEDPSVRALAARALEKRVPYCRRTIEKCDTYKAWRADLKRLRMEAAEADMADVLDAGLARIRKKKPGRGRLADPTIDPAVEKMTKEFLRLHGEKGLGGQ